MSPNLSRRYGARASTFCQDSPRSTWDRSKSAGTNGEQAVARYFQRRGFQVYQGLDCTAVDLILEKPGAMAQRVEVKRDNLAARTGRVAIEVAHRGRPSGIFATSADVWALVIGAEAILVPTDKLLALIERGRFARVRGGDFAAAEVVLVPTSDLRGIPLIQIVRLFNQEDV